MDFWAYIFETVHQILMIFSQMLDIIALNDLASLQCTRKFLFVPQAGGIYPQKYPFLAKMVRFSLYLQNRTSDFDDFCIDVRDSCPEWFGPSDVQGFPLDFLDGGTNRQFSVIFGAWNQDMVIFELCFKP